MARGGERPRNEPVPPAARDYAARLVVFVRMVWFVLLAVSGITTIDR